MSRLQEKKEELANFSKFALPFLVLFIIISLANSVNFAMGSLVFPDAIRPLLLPLMAVGFVIFFPVNVRLIALRKEVQALQESEK